MSEKKASNLTKMCLGLSYLEPGSPLKAYALIKECDKEPELLWKRPDALRDKIVALFDESFFSKIKFVLSEEFFEYIDRELTAFGIKAVTYFDRDYPDFFREMPDPPLTLFCRGDTALLKKTPALAVVGTRKNTSYGRRVTEHFVGELANDFVIVSGLALGIDSLAHRTALAKKGKTVAVLGGGLNNVYPYVNKGLAQEIAENGGLVFSEFKPSAESSAFQFPMRNRLIAALSDGVLLVEAGMKSGAFGTIDFATEMGKHLFVVPGEIYNFASGGANEIIKSYPGCMVTAPEEIRKRFLLEKFRGTKGKKAVQLSQNEQLVVELLKTDRLHFNELLSRSKIKTGELSYLLSVLELKGLITKLPGNNYQLDAEAFL